MRKFARMKSLFAVICLLAGATLLTAENAPVRVTTPVNPNPKPKPVEVTTPAKSGEKAKVEGKKEAEPVIPGVAIPRPNGTFLGLQVADGFFKLSFYTAKKKPMAVDVTRAAVRWPNNRNATGPNRDVLNLSGEALVGNKKVLPPLTVTVFLTLLKGDGDDAKAVEEYVVAFHD